MRRRDTLVVLPGGADDLGCTVYKVSVTQRLQRVSDDAPRDVAARVFHVRSCVTGVLNADAAAAYARKVWPDHVTVGLVGVTYAIEVENLGPCRHTDHEST